MQSLTPLESSVLAKTFDGDHPALRQLTEQCRALEVVFREYTGVGFFTELRVPSQVASLKIRAAIRFGDVLADIRGLENGAGFLVYLDDGLITALEGYTFGEAWPERIDVVALRYSREPRDLSVF